MSEYVIFSIGGQLMAIPIENVKRVMSIRNITKIPLYFDYIEGALNYHG